MLWGTELTCHPHQFKGKAAFLELQPLHRAKAKVCCPHRACETADFIWAETAIANSHPTRQKTLSERKGLISPRETLAKERMKRAVPPMPFCFWSAPPSAGILTSALLGSALLNSPLKFSALQQRYEAASSVSTALSEVKKTTARTRIREPVYRRLWATPRDTRSHSSCGYLHHHVQAKIFTQQLGRRKSFGLQ